MGKTIQSIKARATGLYLNILAYLWPARAQRLAYKLFSTPHDGKLDPADLPQMLASATRETIGVGNDKMETYHWKGAGGTVLLAHGWDSNSWRWERLLPFLLGSGFNVVAVDAPGHGLSGGLFSLPKYAAFLDAAARKFNADFLIGHSIGGAAALFYQYRYRNPNLKKMVVLGAPADLNPILDNFHSLLGSNQKVRQLLSEYFVRNFSMHPDRFEARVFGEALTLPGFIAHDSGDDVVLFSESQKIKKHWPMAEFIETAGLGHSMHDDALYEKIVGFLKRTEQNTA
jgi:pimeloyl-ACP methyl ester carboxylesterase